MFAFLSEVWLMDWLMIPPTPQVHNQKQAWKSLRDLRWSHKLVVGKCTSLTSQAVQIDKVNEPFPKPSSSGTLVASGARVCAHV